MTRLALAAASLSSSPAMAAGGAHLVDDSEVEKAGDCHVETWLSDTGVDTTHMSLGVGCTPGALTMIELGVFAGHNLLPGPDDTVLGVASKVTMRPAASGLGVALSGSLGYGADRSRLETASVLGAMTLPAAEGITINLNAGWVWSEAGRGSELIAGAQVEWAVGSNLTLMAEGVTRNHDKPGGQAGVRWTTGGGRIDVDALVGRYGDGVTPTWVTLGLTVRG